jgi:hypothetical protein
MVDSADPDCFWQCVQWHAITAKGGHGMLYRTAPHRQPPSLRSVIRYSLSTARVNHVAQHDRSNPLMSNTCVHQPIRYGYP